MYLIKISRFCAKKAIPCHQYGKEVEDSVMGSLVAVSLVEGCDGGDHVTPRIVVYN